MYCVLSVTIKIKIKGTYTHGESDRYCVWSVTIKIKI